jgi:GDPmannose 4,6-dehydratase
VLGLVRLISRIRPCEIYNLAAQSSVSQSFLEPATTISSNVQSLINILESVQVVGHEAKIYQASSSEMFGNTISLPLNENSRLDPVSPYGISKTTCHRIIKYYRDSFGMFACSGILFNHESVLRSPHFFVKKVVREAVEVARGRRKTIKLGNLEVSRDFGCAKEYVKPMWLMLQRESPSDYVISSGRSIKLRSIVEFILGQLGVDLNVIETSQKFFRPSEISEIYGDSSKAKRELGWSFQSDFFSVIETLIDYEVDLQGRA